MWATATVFHPQIARSIPSFFPSQIPPKMCLRIRGRSQSILYWGRTNSFVLKMALISNEGGIVFWPSQTEGLAKSSGREWSREKGAELREEETGERESIKSGFGPFLLLYFPPNFRAAFAWQIMKGMRDKQIGCACGKKAEFGFGKGSIGIGLSSIDLLGFHKKRTAIICCYFLLGLRINLRILK